jgi:HEAT repeat protein
MTPGLGPIGDSPRVGRTDPAAWQSWWRFNRDAYLDLKRILAGMETRTAADGGTNGAPKGERSTPVTESMVRRDVAPALQKVLEGGGRFDVLRSTVIALARVESTWGEGESITSRTTARHFLSQPATETAEAGVVALGIRGDRESVDTLIDLLLDTPKGRELRKTEKVDYRLRSLSAFSLGLIGAQHEDSALRIKIAMAFIENLEANANAPFDTQLASLIAMGMVPMPPCEEPSGTQSSKSVEEHFCRGRQVAMLLDYMADQRRHTRLRAQAAIPLARLTLQSSEEHQRIVTESLLGALDPKEKAAPEIKQACVLALGVLGDGDDDALDQAIVDALGKEVARGDRLSRPFALVALAKAAGDLGNHPNSGKSLAKAQSLLLKQMTSGKNGMDAWASISLGVLGRTLAENKQVVADEVAQGLRQSLASAKTSDEVAAASLALGLLRDNASAEAMIQKLEKVTEPTQRACVALALGLTAAPAAREPLLATLSKAKSDSDEFRHLAIGARLLGERTSVARVADAARSAADPLTKAGLLSTLGVMGDAAGVAPLVAAVLDKSQSDEVRASAAAALGELCDGHARPWSASISQDLHYDLLSSTLVSYSGDGSGLLEMR